eukprot:Sro1078_g238770.1 PI-PLC X domain-containing protein 2 (154) ;mRNA; r:19431-19892
MKAAVTLSLDHENATDEEIQRAAQEGSFDVTKTVRSFVKRNTVLYLTDIQKDLELKSDRGTLTIAYKMIDKNGADQFYVSTIDFDRETEVLISPFCRNEEQTVHNCIEPHKHPNGGCVKGGRICCKEDATARGAETVIEFTTTEKGCEFGISH